MAVRPRAPKQAAPGPGRGITRRNREADVLTAAIKVFAQKGYAEASIKDLADEVGVLKGSLYYYIDSKQGLLRRIFDDAHDQTTAIMASAAALEAEPLERLRAYFELHVRWYLENVEHARIFFRELDSLTGEHREVVRRRRRSYQEFITGLIDDCRRAGDIGAEGASRPALLFVLGAINAAPEWYRRGGRYTPAEMAVAYAELTVATLTGVRAWPDAPGTAASPDGAAGGGRR